jgi:hypothetical protein
MPHEPGAPRIGSKAISPAGQGPGLQVFPGSYPAVDCEYLFPAVAMPTCCFASLSIYPSVFCYAMPVATASCSVDNHLPKQHVQE